MPSLASTEQKFPSQSIKSVLVTGGAGFIGSHTVDLLLEHGLRVIVYDNLMTGKVTHLNLFHPQLEFIPEDVLNYSTLLKQVKRVDAVLHLAALASVQQSIEDPLGSLRINTQGFLHVLQAIHEAKRPVRLVFASSAAVYGNCTHLPCHEEFFDVQPMSPYALEKANNERYARLYEHLFHIPSLGLRYFNVYGPRQDPASPYSGVIAKLIAQHQKGEAVTLFGDGKQCRDFIYVGDVARANLLALQNDCTGILNIATGIPETLCNLVHYIEQTGGQSTGVNFAAERPGDIRESYASIEKAEKSLSFRYNTKLSDGIRLLMNESKK